MTIAITGATGFLGHAVLDAAITSALPVRALTRKPQSARAGVEWIAGDLGDAAALEDLCRGVAAVIHVAGLVNAPDPTQFATVNVEGTRRLIAAAQAAKVPRLVLVSSLAAREPALSAYGASKAAAEQLVQGCALDWTIVRPPAIYGPRDTELFELFAAARRWGIVPVPSRGATSIVHADDLAALLLALVPGGEQVSRRIFEPDDGTPGGWPHPALARAIGVAVGRRPGVLRLSPRVLRLAARCDVWLRGSKAKLTPDRASYMAHPDWVVSPGARVPPGIWQARIPTPSGLAATAQWYREERWLWSST